MKRSLAELRHGCQKAGEGAGLPAGLDVATAQAVVWLAARGLDPLPAFLGSLEAVHEGRAVCRLAPSAADRIDAAGAAGACVAPGLVDLLLVRGRLAVSGLTDPLFLLPAADRQLRAGQAVGFDFDDGAGGRTRALVQAGGAVDLFGPSLPPAGGVFTVTASCPAEVAEPGPAPLVDDKELRSRAAKNLAQGITVAPEDWERLQAFAMRVLVPATDQSRSSGAGWSGSLGSR